MDSSWNPAPNNPVYDITADGTHLYLAGGFTRMGNSNVHAHKRVPVLLMGKANGGVKGNYHLKCNDRTPNANLLLSIVNKLGTGTDKIGDSTGEVSL